MTSPAWSRATSARRRRSSRLVEALLCLLAPALSNSVRVGTTPSVISHIEDDDYEGHSLSMLRRIAAALNKRVEIRLVPRKPKQCAA